MNRLTRSTSRQASAHPGPDEPLATVHREPPAAEAAPHALDGLLGFDPGVHILAHLRPTDLTPPLPEEDIRRWARDLRNLALTNQAIAQRVRAVAGDDLKQLCWALRFTRCEDAADAVAWRSVGDASQGEPGADGRLLLQKITSLLDPALATPGVPDAARNARWRLSLLVRPLMRVDHRPVLETIVGALMEHARAQAATPSAQPVDLAPLAHRLIVAAANRHGMDMVPATAAALQPLNAHFVSLTPQLQAACLIELAVLNRAHASWLEKRVSELHKLRDGSPDAATRALFDRARDELQDIVGFLQAPNAASNEAVARRLERLPTDDIPWGPADVTVLAALSHLAQPPKGVPCGLPVDLRLDTARAVRRWLRHLCALNKGHAHVHEQFLLSSVQPTVLWHALRGLGPAQMCWLLRRNPGTPAHATLASLVHALSLDASVPLDARIDVLRPWLAAPAPGQRDSLSEPARAALQADLDQLLAERNPGPG
ncbi:MAG: hypothetical protein IBJ04_17415 [Hydrogenophaga sp.]|uniref:hypothetical protein n=1 Tax=Hydrogenophaga sp. TaxID=1904254 RepID=UPI00257D97C5|nr:hypothetical protein [Hydrogenophaga sp.]MBL0946100.1 hypothetical protein [Hydrogenophaga sp.]